MRIGTWNVERLKHKKSLMQIVGLCESSGADILVLTETNTEIVLDYECCIHSGELHRLNPELYGEHENRVSIFSRYKCVALHDTYDKYTCLCAELETEKGKLLVYGTIIGIFGNRHPSFEEELQKTEEDIRRLSQLKKPICVVGDYNLSFGDNYYFTKNGRSRIQNLFKDCEISLLTKTVPECIDHIAAANGLWNESNIHISEWNRDKKLSDHKGILVDF